MSLCTCLVDLLDRNSADQMLLLKRSEWLSHGIKTEAAESPLARLPRPLLCVWVWEIVHTRRNTCVSNIAALGEDYLGKEMHGQNFKRAEGRVDHLIIWALSPSLSLSFPKSLFNNSYYPFISELDQQHKHQLTRQQKMSKTVYRAV